MLKRNIFTRKNAQSQNQDAAVINYTGYKNSIDTMTPLTSTQKPTEENFPRSYQALFWLFLIGSVLGFILEGFWCIAHKGHWENHSATVWGPFCIIYGLGAVAIYVLSTYLKDKNIFVQFALCAASGTLIEYFASVFQEICFGSYSWNYSAYVLNLGGRVSLKMMVIWGLLGVVFMRILFRHLASFLKVFTGKGWKTACIFLSVYMSFNLIVTSAALLRWEDRINGVEPTSAAAEWIDRTWNDERMELLYPNMTFYQTAASADSLYE